MLFSASRPSWRSARALRSPFGIGRRTPRSASAEAADTRGTRVESARPPIGAFRIARRSRDGARERREQQRLFGRGHAHGNVGGRDDQKHHEADSPARTARAAARREERCCDDRDGAEHLRSRCAKRGLLQLVGLPSPAEQEFCGFGRAPERDIAPHGQRERGAEDGEGELIGHRAHMRCESSSEGKCENSANRRARHRS